MTTQRDSQAADQGWSERVSAITTTERRGRMVNSAASRFNSCPGDGLSSLKYSVVL